MFKKRQTPQNPDDIFAETRMSFGDHIEELRTHLIRAIQGLLIVLVGGMILDAVGKEMKWEYVGLGRPMMKVLTDPVESQVRDFYATRYANAKDRLNIERTPEDEAKRILDKLNDNEGKPGSLTSAERQKLRGIPREMPVIIPVEPLVPVFGPPKDPSVTEIELKMKVYPAYINYASMEGEGQLGIKQHVSSLSVQEPMVTYFKVLILCSVVISSPWIFFQIWSFVAAGLYPHERDYVYKFLGPSLGLFLTGVFVCQFIVLPGAVKALVAFNDWIDLDPDIRLNEWLKFALFLPLVFGISFQTPLVMFFLNRIGMFSWEDYWAKWRYAVIILAVFAAIITPTPDAVTMLYLFIPMFGLYIIGVLVCKYFPPAHELEDAAEAAAADQVAV